MTIVHQIPTIDISPYLDPDSSKTERAKVIDQVKLACSQYGFLQVKGHGVPLELQRGVLQCCKSLFDLPAEHKERLSLKNNAARSGYERIGEQILDHRALPDCKEGFYVGAEVPPDQIGFKRGPNQWPDLPEEEFRMPVMAYYEHMLRISKSLLEILVLGLDLDVGALASFTRDPCMNLKLLHYPPHISKDARQFGAAAHTDFGAMTTLLQQPGKDGLQVYHAPTDEWLAIPAIEDILVINMGDLIEKWTDGKYSSTLHRVINSADGDRYSVPCFYEGDMSATNPFNPNDTSGETVEQHVRRKFDRTYGLDEK